MYYFNKYCSKQQFPQSSLYLVATPIGNLADISLRALATLEIADYVYAEDSRNSAKLLNHYNINLKNPISSYHDHSDQNIRNNIIQKLQDGCKIALISDAGTPLIADPGYKLVQDCIANNINVTAIPGASAIITALSSSGATTESFSFIGFLPNTSRDKQSKLLDISENNQTIICYESSHRIKKTIELMASHNELKQKFTDRTIIICRELTKKYEEYIRGSIDDILQWAKTHQAKGEYVIIFDKAKNLHHPNNDNKILHATIIELLKYQKTKEICNFITSNYPLSRNQAYEMIERIKNHK